MAWDTEWAADRASEAMAYLAKNYPECGGAIVEDRDGYLEALRSYMRAGRDEALRIRKEAA